MTRALADRRRGLTWWSIGVGVYVVMIVAFYPTIRDSDSYAEVAEDYPDAVKELFGGAERFDFTTGVGFVDVQLYSLILPALLVAAAVGYGAAILGGEREAGLLDLVLANPLTRRRLATEKAVGLVVTVAILATVAGTGVAVAGAAVDLGVAVGNIVAATATLALLALFHGLVAMGAGAWTGRRASGVAAGVVVFLFGYLISVLAGLVDALSAIDVLSPYQYYAGSDPLVDGWSVIDVGVLVGLCAAAFVATAGVFEGRDLT